MNWVAWALGCAVAAAVLITGIGFGVTGDWRWGAGLAAVVIVSVGAIGLVVMALVRTKV